MRDTQTKLFEEDALMDINGLGAWGETRAARYLMFRGYRLLERNFSCRYGEIDIIAAKRGYVVFVEVKLRKNADFGEAKDFVTVSKQNKVRAAAEIWLSKNETELDPRFDVIEIYAPNGMSRRGLIINHLENAF